MNVQIEQFLIKMESVKPFPLTALLMIFWTDFASPAIMDMTLLMVNASSHLPIMLKLLILDAKFGIGTIKYVSNAPIDGLSTQTESVSLYLTTAESITLLEHVSHATMDTI